MSVNQMLRESLPEGSIVFDNQSYDGSIVGVTSTDQVVYDFNKMVEELVKEQHMTEQEAVEYIEYNTIGCLPYLPDPRPIVMFPIEGV